MKRDVKNLKILGLLVAGTLVFSVSLANAGERAAMFGSSWMGPSFYFTADAPPKPAEAPKVAPTPEPAAGAVALFPCVKYRDPCNIAPCAVPKIVQVADPCPPPKCCNPCNPCAPCCPPPPRCVSVKICVPPECPCSCPPKVTCRNGGKYVRYDYGKYAVDIRVKKGFVVVDYDD